MLKPYDYPDCPYGQKVRVVLAEKELEYETVLVDLRKQEQRTPEFLRLNPLGKVPVLVDDDEVICDSTIINEYLEDEYPSTRLMPEDSQGRAQVRWFEDYGDNEFVPYTTQLLVQLRKPDAERDAQQVEQIRERLRRGLYLLRDRLDSNEYLVGAQFTLADAAWAPGCSCSGASASSSSRRSRWCRPGSIAFARARASRRSVSDPRSQRPALTRRGRPRYSKLVRTVP
jgi:glutathione S-transferase